MAGSPKSTTDQVSSGTRSSRGSLLDSNLDTASGECLSCSDTNEISMRTVHKKYRERVRVSYKSSKGVDWMDIQMKRIKGGHQDGRGQDLKIVSTEQRCTLADDHTSFKMRRMATRTDQLICIAKATGSKSTPGSQGAQGSAKALVLSLKQSHAHYYRLYKKGVIQGYGLQGLHSSDAFWHLNVLTSVGLKSFCPWCLIFGGNTEQCQVASKLGVVKM